MKYIPPNFENGTHSELLEAMNAAPLKRYYIRFQSIHLLSSGFSPQEAAISVLRTERTIRGWIRLWNRGGVDALWPQNIPGRPKTIKDDDKKKIINLLDNPGDVDETHWTARKLHGFITDEWSLDLGYSTLTRSIKKWGYRFNVPRPWPLKQDEELRETFRQELAELLDNDEQEIWFCDETGVLGDPRPCRRWMKKGEAGTVPFLGKHLRSNVVGAVHPKTGELFSLIVSHMNTDMFQVFLNQFAKETEGRNVVLILDNATWHKVKRLNWHHVDPLYLPPYSPDLNPIERLWLVMKNRFFNNWIAKTEEQLENRVAEALNNFLDNETEVASICRV